VSTSLVFVWCAGDFPRMDNDMKAQATKKTELKQLQEQVLGMVHARGQQTLEDKRTQYKNDMMELMDVQSTLDQVGLCAHTIILILILSFSHSHPHPGYAC
jgi:hypothetical protein